MSNYEITIAPVVDMNLIGVVDVAPLPTNAVHAGTYVINKSGLAGSTIVSKGSIVTWNKYRNDYIVIGKVGQGQRFVVAGYQNTVPEGTFVEHDKRIVTYNTNDPEADIAASFVASAKEQDNTVVTVQFAGSLFAYTQFKYDAIANEWNEINSTRTREIGWVPQPAPATVDISQITGLDISGAAEGDVLKIATGGTIGAEKIKLTELSDVTITPDATNKYLFVGEPGSNWTAADTPVGITKLSELEDVNLTALANGDVLTFDETAVMWESTNPRAPVVVELTLPAESDVAVTDLVAKNAAGDIVKASVTEQAIVGIVTGRTGDKADVLISGRFDITEFGAKELSAADVLYLDNTTAGLITNVRPTTVGDTIVRVGLMTSPTEVEIKIDHEGILHLIPGGT